MSENTLCAGEKDWETKYFFKVGLEMASGSRPLWIAVRARSMGEAVVIADARCQGTPFQICSNLVKEISHTEYWRMIESAIELGGKALELKTKLKE